MEATFGAGCFWCIEACFKDVKGITDVSPGYAGGSAATANYKDVCSGGTDHAEVARIVYDSELISFERLLELFWFVHDPTQLNRQGNDVGRQYRSVVFYHNEEQRNLTETYKKKLNDSEVWDKPVVTEISPIPTFYPAEEYHKNYLALNPQNPYCQSIVRPKVDKFKATFSDIMK
ncbi:MAG: peptide-methionine (S)-S-oxide reductase MsrA [Crocinitomicaceae bacterium]